MNESIAANQLSHVRERLAWLDAQPGYSGSGGIALRPLAAADIGDGLRLCRDAGWNQRADDWRLFLELRPEGCRAAVHMGAVVGTVTTLAYGSRCGWIGMVLVDRQRRRLGIGTRLMGAAIELLAHCPAIGLDATIAGKAVYDRLGFVDRFPLARMIRRQAGPAVAAAPAGIRPMAEGDLAAVAALDAQTFGTAREPLMRWLFGHGRDRAWVACGADGAVAGFAFGRPGEVFDHIGPVVAADGALAAGLLQAALAALDGRAVGLDIYLHPGWRLWLESNGFSEERRFMRMARGTMPAEGRLDRLFATAGPELG